MVDKTKEKATNNRQLNSFVAIFFTGFLLFGLAALIESSLTVSQKIAIWGGLAVVIGLIGAAISIPDSKSD